VLRFRANQSERSGIMTGIRVDGMKKDKKIRIQWTLKYAMHRPEMQQAAVLSGRLSLYTFLPVSSIAVSAF
jgi:hypothetical protein